MEMQLAIVKVWGFLAKIILVLKKIVHMNPIF